MQAMQPAAGSLGLLLAVVGAVAVIVRVAFLAELLHRLPLFAQTYPGFDPDVFNRWAQEIAGGDWLSRARGVFYRAALYPYLLSVVYLLAGSGNVVAGLVMNCLLGMAGALCAAGVGRRLFGWWAGLAAGLLTALSGAQLSAEALLLVDSLLPAFFLGALWLMLRLLEGEEGEGHPKLALWVLPGLLLGLAAAGRGSNLLVAAALCACVLVFALRGGPRRLAGAAVLTGVGVWLVVTPMVLRNGLMFERWTVSTNGPATLYLSNAPGSTGVFGYPPRFEEVQARAAASGNPQGVWLGELWRELKAQPSALPEALLRKTLLVLNAYDAPDNGNYYFVRRYVPVVRWLSVGPVVLYALGLAGLILTAGRRRGLVVLYVFGISLGATLVLFHVAGRFKLPILAWLGIFAGGGIVAFVRGVRAGTRRMAVGAPVLAAMIVVACWPRVPIRTIVPYGQLTLRPVEFTNHSAALARAKRLDEAIAMMEDACDLFPGELALAERLAGLYLAADRPDAALRAVEEAQARGLSSERLSGRKSAALRRLEQADGPRTAPAPPTGR